jgi:N-acetylmuramoyl-L-alanine amidase
VPAPAAAATHAPATARLPLATLRGVRRSTVGTAIRLTLEFDGEVAAAPQEIDGPRRVFFDFDRTDAVAELRDAVLTFEGPAARRARIGQPKPSTTRFVVDLDGVASYSHFALYNPYRVMIDLVPVDATPAPLTARTLAASPLAPRPGVTGRDLARDLRAAERIVPRPLPHPLADRPVAVAAVPSPRPVAAAFLPPPLQGRTLRRSLGRLTPLPAVASGVTAAAVEARVTADLARRQRPIAAREPAPATVPAPVAPVENGAGGFSIARQLGLGVSRIVIDPGHGGHDPGAMGHRTTEAEVVLDVALRLEKLLNAEGTFDVVLTRRSNVYIALEERTAVANRAGADLFLSIHANSSRNRRATGVETYYLNFASNPEAEAVAARENATAARSMHQLPEMVRAIALNNNLDESRDFARLVQDAMVTRLKPHNGQLRDLGVKQAPFVVLIGATMPSVLAEIAFISNDSEGSLLRQGQYRQRVAEALFDSVKRYQRALKQVGTVASQQ